MNAVCSKKGGAQVDPVCSICHMPMTSRDLQALVRRISKLVEDTDARNQLNMMNISWLDDHDTNSHRVCKAHANSSAFRSWVYELNKYIDESVYDGQYFNLENLIETLLVVSKTSSRKLDPRYLLNRFDNEIEDGYESDVAYFMDYYGDIPDDVVSRICKHMDVISVRRLARSLIPPVTGLRQMTPKASALPPKTPQISPLHNIPYEQHVCIRPPPGKVFNPRTNRFIKADGELAVRLGLSKQ